MNKSIFDIQNEYLELTNQIEECDGELTPELEEALVINEENFQVKIENYVKVVKHKQSEIVAINDELQRLTSLKERNEKTIERLENVMLHAIELFGSTNKSGNKIYETALFKLGTRKSKKVVVSEDELNGISESISSGNMDSLTYNLLSPYLRSTAKVEIVGNVLENINDIKSNNPNIKLTIKVEADKTNLKKVLEAEGLTKDIKDYIDPSIQENKSLTIK